MKIAVTGSTGFVGQPLCDALQRQGHAVVRISRRAGPELTVADLSETDQLDAAFRDVHTVIHLAARVHIMRDDAVDPLQQYRALNVEGTRNVMRAATNAGVQHVVVFSTVKVHGEGRNQPYTEADPIDPNDAYARSKAEAEDVAVSLANHHHRVTVLRPPLIYGPGARANFARLLGLARMSCRMPLPLGRTANRRSLLALDNLIDAISRVLVVDAPSAAYLLRDGDDLSTSELLMHLGSAFGTPRLFAWPPRLLRTALSLVGRRDEADRLLGSLTVDDSRFRRVFAWKPPVPAADALRRTAEHWARAATSP